MYFDNEQEVWNHGTTKIAVDIDDRDGIITFDVDSAVAEAHEENLPERIIERIEEEVDAARFY